MKNFHKQQDYWKPCRPGTIREVSDSKFVRERRKFIVRTAMGSVVAGLGLFVGVFAINHDRRRSEALVKLSENNSSKVLEASVTQIRLSCNDIMESLGDYVVAVKTESKEQTLDQRVLISNFKQHMAVCPLCDEIVGDAMQS